MTQKIVAILIIFISISSFAQKNNTSAYSFFGIGNKNSANTVEQLSMGGIGVTLNESFSLNFTNPASNTSLLFTTYSLAIEHKNTTVKDATNKQNASATHLSYLALGFPIGEKAGLTFGLLPNSTVGYSLVSRNLDSENNIIDATVYSGEGGTNKVFLSFGYKPFKELSVGLQGNYIFGKIENSLINQVDGASLATKYQTISNIKGFSLNVGFQYKTKLNNNIDLHIGGAIGFENKIDSEGNEYLYSVSLETFESPRDTILNVKSTGTIKSPLKTTIGVGFGKENKWFTGIDYSFQNAIEIKGNVFDNFTKVAYDKYSKIAIGGFYTPKFNSITSYWDRVTYRAGLKFEKTGLMIDALNNDTDFTAIDDFGISFGVGLPIGNQLSKINVGFEIGKRGKTEKDLIQENYFNFRLSLTLSDKWFKKIEIF